MTYSESSARVIRCRVGSESASQRSSQARATGGIALSPDSQLRTVRSSRPITRMAKRRADKPEKGWEWRASFEVTGETLRLMRSHPDEIRAHIKREGEKAYDALRKRLLYEQFAGASRPPEET